MVRPLAALAPYILAANVRAELDGERVRFREGVGHDGDLVVGRVMASPENPVPVRDRDGVMHRTTRPTRVVAPLGTRDSSTHVCARLPKEGLGVTAGAEAAWVAGESGIVSVVERPPVEDSTLSTDSASRFLLEGLVTDADGRALNTRDFVVRPTLERIGIPVVLVGGTSAESGKTTLLGAVTTVLSERGVRVGAVKATGTGGVRDSRFHREAGAAVTLNCVDAGLVSTHGDADEVAARIPGLFRRVEELGAEVVFGELGGDLVSAGNPAILRVGELTERTGLVLIVCNDALAAHGARLFMEAETVIPGERVRYLSSPFRNHAGMSRRMRATGIETVYDPRSPEDVTRLADEVHSLLG